MSRRLLPKITVGGVILNSKNKILLVRSHKWQGIYIIPGEHVVWGQKPEEAIRGEIKEKTGLKIFKIKFLCFQEFVFDKLFWKKKHFVFFDYTCQTNSSKVKLNREGQDFFWIDSKKAVKSLQIEPYAFRSLKKFLKTNYENSQ